MNKKGFVLVTSYMIVSVLLIVGIAFVMSSINERRALTRDIENLKSLYVADAGIEYALYKLDQSDTWSPASNPVVVDDMKYSLTIGNLGEIPWERKITSVGYFPDYPSYQAKREIVATVKKDIPLGFYDNAIYVAEEVDINGNSFSITGNVKYGEEADIQFPGRINGTLAQDTSIDPLARLNFQTLRNEAVSQGNVYDAARLQAVRNGSDHFPASFMFSATMPNIVYLESDLILNGSIGTIGGFFVVAGDVLTDPNDTADVTINGSGQIDGCIYTRGEFDINGGGGGLNVNGGVWAGDEVGLNGNVNIAYNREYMTALENSELLKEAVQIVAWQDSQYPF